MYLDPVSLMHDLERLPRTHRVVFAAACCERLLLNSAAFWREVQWGQPANPSAALVQRHLQKLEIT
jgi:uncharacterized protein YjaG (DUF416 family)